MDVFDMADEWTRRHFLATSSIGGGTLLLSGVFGAGCGGGSAPPPSAPKTAMARTTAPSRDVDNRAIYA